MTQIKTSEPTLNESPIRSLIGALISGGMATGLYFFSISVAHKLAAHPFTRAESLADRVGAAFRTILLAIGSGITMIFAVIAIGLVLLAIKQVNQKFLAKPLNSQPETDSH